MWKLLIVFLENLFLKEIEQNANHPDQIGWIKRALSLITIVGSEVLESYVVPRLADWIESQSDNAVKFELVELAMQALAKRGGEIGKIASEANTEALKDLQNKHNILAEQHNALAQLVQENGDALIPLVAAANDTPIKSAIPAKPK